MIESRGVDPLEKSGLLNPGAGLPKAVPGGGLWMQAISHLDPVYGGVSAVVPQLAASLAREGFRSEIASFSPSDETYALEQYAGAEPELAAAHWTASRSAWLRQGKLRAYFRRRMEVVDGVHIHGLWETHTSVAAHGARALNKPYILSAHGMLESWALANKRLKKKIYSAIVERRNIEHAACLHALTQAEAEDYRRFGSRRPIAVIPNGISLPASVNGALFLEHFPELKGKRIILYLGRLHFKKGVDILIEAWAELAGRFPEAVLVMAGPDCEGTRVSLELSIVQRGLSGRVVFTGMLAPAMKWSALANAHCFTLPSYSEGLSVAVLEALGMGVPVIISDRCNLPEVQQYNAGWQIRATADELTEALQEMLRNEPAANAERGSRGRRLVHDRFSWPVVGRQMAELYSWVQGGARPQSFPLLEEIA